MGGPEKLVNKSKMADGRHLKKNKNRDGCSIPIMDMSAVDIALQGMSAFYAMRGSNALFPNDFERTCYK